MTRGTRQEVVECDTERLYGSIPEAIKYLQEVHRQHPNATLEEHWTGYEDMEMRFLYYRPETDTEYTIRKIEEDNAKSHYAEQEAKRKDLADKTKKLKEMAKEWGVEL